MSSLTVNSYEILITLLVSGVWVYIFKNLRSTESKKHKDLLQFLKSIEKSIRSGSILNFSSQMDSCQQQKLKIDPFEDIKSTIVQSVDRAIRSSIESRSKILFVKDLVSRYNSFLKEKFYFCTIFKNKILFSMIVAVLIRYVAVYLSESKFESYLRIDTFFVFADLICLLYLARKLKQKINSSFIHENTSLLKEWIDTYFYTGFNLAGSDIFNSSVKNQFMTKILEFYHKQIKEGVSYREDIKEYLEEWISSELEEREESFRKKVEFFPAIELVSVGGTCFFLILVPLCSIM